MIQQLPALALAAMEILKPFRDEEDAL